MKLKEAIERVKSMYSKGAPSDDARLSSRHIYSKLKSARSFLLTRELNKNKRLSERNIEYIECIPLEKALPYECPCLPPIGCTILKSKCEIPKFISNKNGDYITSVTSIDGSYTFSPTTFEDKKYKAYNKYTKKALDYFIKNNYLYITSSEIIPAATMGGIIEDVTSFNCEKCDKESEDACIDVKENEFKVDSYLIEPIIEAALQELVLLFSQNKEDKENESSDN